MECYLAIYGLCFWGRHYCLCYPRRHSPPASAVEHWYSNPLVAAVTGAIVASVIAYAVKVGDRHREDNIRESERSTAERNLNDERSHDEKVRKAEREHSEQIREAEHRHDERLLRLKLIEATIKRRIDDFDREILESQKSYGRQRDTCDAVTSICRLPDLIGATGLPKAEALRHYKLYPMEFIEESLQGKLADLKVAMMTYATIPTKATVPRKSELSKIYSIAKSARDGARAELEYTEQRLLDKKTGGRQELQDQIDVLREMMMDQ